MATAPIQEPTKNQVPYVPYKTFKSAIEQLEQHGLPNRIDRTLWPSFSGVIQSQLLSAFRFFGLIASDGTPSTQLDQLVHEKINKKAILRHLLKTYYPSLLAIDLPKATSGQFMEAMRKFELSPETTKKASSFFLQAAKDAELPLSKHILDKIRTVARGKRKASSRIAGDAGLTGPQILHPATTSGPIRKVTLDNGVVLSISTTTDMFSMTKRDRAFVLELLDRLDKEEDDRGDGSDDIEISED
jgi:hypothetical protein